MHRGATRQVYCYPRHCFLQELAAGVGEAGEPARFNKVEATSCLKPGACGRSRPSSVESRCGGRKIKQVKSIPAHMAWLDAKAEWAIYNEPKGARC